MTPLKFEEDPSHGLYTGIYVYTYYIDLYNYYSVILFKENLWNIIIERCT